jgi:hypothetical protein
MTDFISKLETLNEAVSNLFVADVKAITAEALFKSSYGINQRRAVEREDAPLLHGTQSASMLTNRS